jgi:hypothetical protein
MQGGYLIHAAGGGGTVGVKEVSLIDKVALQDNIRLDAELGTTS